MSIHRVSLTRAAHVAVCLLALGSGMGAMAQAPAPRVAPAGGIWSAGAGFEFALKDKKALKTRRSVSGLACNLNAKGERVCLMAFDEGVQARYAVARDGQLLPDPQPVELARGDGELDAEGAASDGRYLYVTGSHSAKRSDCASNPDSRHVVRMALDPQTGKAQAGPVADTGRLWSVMQSVPGLSAYVGDGKCLGSEPGQQGINIEGLAVRDGRLYFGFRAPVLQGTAMVLSVDAEALFGAGDPKPVLARVALGANRGIRDMVAVKDGFLLLAGPDDGKANQGVAWTIHGWDGKASAQGARTKHLATLDLRGVALRSCDAELKPEALAVLQETASTYQVLVLSDGMCDGGPLAFTLAR
ncbi:DUF3616 domain-containing protein [Rhodoferax aquaticus]|uniref:DUF3616 domain-containing protein n=1 Tax=Rhodoferax aquaticus TaxID=2527691 RepID=A0A515EJY7_9BURK|nr:DUF3616 domain-containing protein [Rhodoferax aquaticus]QDL52960.1 DUF3616 domain-containing protein [Rhodoferax aquaticus]